MHLLHSQPRIAPRALRAAAALLAAILLATCSDSPTGLGAPGFGTVAVSPVLPQVRQFAGLVLDGVHLVAVRPPTDTVADIRQSFSASSSQLTITAPVLLRAVAETLDVTLEYFSGATLLFRTSGPLVVRQGVTTPVQSDNAFPPPTYFGTPVATLGLQPRDTTVLFGATLPFRVTALDANQAPVTQYYVSWRTTPAGGLVDGAGTLTAASARQTFYVVATTPDSTRDSTTVTITAPLSRLVKVSGDSQTSPPQSRPSLPLTVQVLGSDNLGLAGVPVTFTAVTGGGFLDSSSTTSDASGSAGTGFSLGSVVGTETFSATVTGIPSVTFTEFAGTPPVQTSISATAGTGQSAPVGTSVAIAPAVGIIDISNDQPVAGVQVVFAVAPGNGTITGAVATTDAQGIARVGSWTLSPTPGVNTLTATAGGGGVIGNPVTFTANGTAGGGSVTWTGAATTDWFLTSNWSTGVVPTVTDNVTIPSGAPRYPVLTGVASMNDLTVQTGATVDLSATGLSVAGNLDAAGTFGNSGGGVVVLVGSGKTLRGNVNNLSISGTYSLAGNVFSDTGTVLAVIGAPASLTLNGHTLRANVFSSNAGLLVMTNPLDSLVVSTIAVFDGGNESGSLTAGVIVMNGDFSQVSTNSTSSFAATGSHKVVFAGATPANAGFFSPGTAASQFRNLEVSGPGGVTLGTDVLATAGVTITLGDINPGSHTLIDQGSFVTSGSGTLTMQSANDSVVVTGAGIFGGGSTAGLLTAGVLKIGGSFSQTAGTSPTAFAASGSHKTVLGSAAVRVATFATPGSDTVGSHFNDLDITAATGGLTLNSNVFVDSTLITTAGGALLTGGTKTLTAGGLNVVGLTVDNAPIVVVEPFGRIEKFDNVTFQNFPTAGATMLNFTGPGGAAAARGITFNTTNFQTLPTGAGNNYVKLVSSNPPFGLVLNMQGSNQGAQVGGNGPTNSSPPNQTIVAGAQILWP